MRARLLRTGSDLSAFLLRIALGTVLFPHGAQNALGWFGGEGLEPTLQYFHYSLGIPLAVGIGAIAVQLLGAICLLVGFLTRVTAFLIAVEMAVAVYLVHLKYGFFMNWTGQNNGEGFEYHLLAIGICLALMLRGGGLWSIDGVIVRRTNKGEIYLPMH